VTTFTDRIEHPDLSTPDLVEITVGEHLRHWTAAGGGAFYASTVATASRTVQEVRVNGVSVAFTWDRVNSRITITPAGGTPYGKTIQAILKFHFATAPHIYNGIYYDPRVSSLPNLSLRINPRFGDTGQIGGGNLDLRNDDGEFDLLTDLQWDAGAVSILVGAYDPKWAPGVDPYLEPGFLTDGINEGFITDGVGEGFQSETNAALRVPGRTAPTYAEYDQAGTFIVTSWDKNDEKFSLKLEEPKSKLKRKIPEDFFSRATYPNMADSDVGKVIPLGYGPLYGIRAVCIDMETRKFMAVGHAIRAFLAVYVQKMIEGSDVLTWQPVPITAPDLTTGTFFLSEADWDGSSAVVVDFEGMVDVYGYLMSNAADVVQNLVETQAGEGSGALHAATLAASKARLTVGTDIYGKPVYHRNLALYLDSAEEVVKIIEGINAVVGSSFHTGYDGKHYYSVFEPQVSEGATIFRYPDTLFSFRERNDTREVLTKINVRYRERREQEYFDSYVYEDPDFQALHNLGSSAVEVIEVPLSKVADAEYVGQREVTERRDKSRTYDARVDRRAWVESPTAFVRIQYPRHGLDLMLEVLEVKKSLDDMLTVDLVLGDLHGLKDTSGFWVEDSPVFPDSLGGGSCETWDANWTDAQKAWARGNVGFWTDDNGFAISTDPDSYLGGAWI